MSDGSNALSVSAALGIAKRQLEEITVRVLGEVSELSSNSRYKAVYFTVKDEKSSMPCMMWKNRYDTLGFDLQIGALVEMTGRFSLYAAKGRMSFDVFSVELAGEGRLRMQVANLAKKLEAEGLMDVSRKKPLPAYPSRIGLVTSPRGAAVYDVLRTLRRRFPVADIVFAGVGVEGAKAPSDMIDALHEVQDSGAEVILLVRGGGSFEDLMPFNDEGLARAISELRVPVITGIGHEPDTSIADMVSDMRASTPTAAAEAAAPSSAELKSYLEARGARLSGMLSSRLQSTSSRLERIASMPIFSEPSRLLESDLRQIDDMSRRLYGAIPGYFDASKRALSEMRTELKIGLSALLPSYGGKVTRQRDALSEKGRVLLSGQSESLKVCSARLDALSPLAVLGRGYSIARNEDGAVLKSVAGISPDDPLSVQMSDGCVECNVVKICKDEDVMEGIDG